MMKRTTKARGLRAVIVATLVLLTAQGWLGDMVNIFIAPPNGAAPPAPSLQGFLAAAGSLEPPPFPELHIYAGVVLVALGVAVLVLSLAWPASEGVRIWSALGLLATLSAALGGYRFVMSGFADGGSSAQMGGSFIGAYACYFLALYSTK